MSALTLTPVVLPSVYIGIPVAQVVLIGVQGLPSSADDPPESVPYQKRLITALNTGRPYMLHGNRWWGFGRTVKKLVDDIQETLPVSRGAEAPVARVEGDPAAALAGAE